MANIRGQITSQNFESGIVVRDCRDFIFQLEPDVTPFISIMLKVAKKKTHNPKFEWFEDALLGSYTQINNAVGYDNAATALVVDDADIFAKYDVVKVVSTGEVLLVTDINVSTNTITVKRGWGTTAAAAIADDAWLFKLGNAQKESYTAPDALVTSKVPKYNYVQSFSKTIELSDIADATQTYGGNRRNYERRKAALELKKQIEAQFLFGEPKLDTEGGEIRYQTGGILYFLGTDAPTLDLSGTTLTRSEFEGLLKDVFLYGSGERFLFCGNLLNSQISDWAESKLQVNPGVKKEYGIEVNTYISANGKVHIVRDQQFRGPYAGWGVVLDAEQLAYRYLDGLDWKFKADIQPRDAHYVKDEYFCTIGLEAHLAKVHGLIKNGGTSA